MALEIDDELVIVCHCSDTEIHPQMQYITVEDNPIKDVGKKVPYVDPDCGESWDSINNNSKTYIWGMHCPIMLNHIFHDKTLKQKNNNNDSNNNDNYLYSNKGVLVDIINNAERVLKPNGMVIFTTDSKKSLMREYNRKLKRENPFHNKWKMKIINRSEFPFYVCYYDEEIGKFQSDERLAIFTIDHGNTVKQRGRSRNTRGRRRTTSANRRDRARSERRLKNRQSLNREPQYESPEN